MFNLMEDVMALGEVIRKYRKAKKMSLQAVGDEMGLSYQSIQKWEKGRSEPNASQVLTLAKVLGVSVEELLQDQGISGNINAILTINDSHFVNIPYLSVSTRTTFIKNFTDTQSVASLTNQTFPVNINNIPFHDGHVVIEIGGPIMEPRLMNGDKVLAEAVTKESFAHVHGGVYAVLYGKEFAVRRIVNNDIEQHSKLFLHADNPKFDPIPVEAKNIRAIWKVIRVVDAPID